MLGATTKDSYENNGLGGLRDSPRSYHSSSSAVATGCGGGHVAHNGPRYEAWGKSARASKLIGSKVYKGDTSIGQIEDVLVDLDHATVTAMILSVGGFLGIGDKLVAVPVNQIKVGSEAKFTTDLTKDQLPTLLLLILPSRNKRPQGARVSLFSGEIPCKLFD